MKDYPTDKLRNVALIGHGTTGKTTLADAMFYVMKSIPRIGDIGGGTTSLDHSDQEKKHGHSLSLGTGFGEWRECRMTILDTPGYDDFLGDQAAALTGADGAVLCVSAVNGVEGGSERAFEAAVERGVPVVISVNLMDKENADFHKAVSQAQEFLSPKAVPLQLPIGDGPDFKGLIDLFKMKAFVYSGPGESKEQDIPDDMKDEAQAAREALIEAAADFDDEVIEKYLEGEKLTDQEILSALTKGVAKAGVYPIVVTSAQQNHGVRRLLDTMVVTLPSPATRRPVHAERGGEDVELTADPAGPLAAQVVKTVVEQHVGEMFLVRVFSGTLKHGSEAYNATREHAEKVGQLFLLQGKERHEVQELKAGEIGALVKLKDTRTGDNLTEKGSPTILPPIPFPDPLSCEAVIPAVKGEEDKIGMAIHKMSEEDPTIRLETDPELHQQLLFCMGELQMEMVMEKLRERKIEVELKKPRIHFRETITKPAQAQGRHKKQSGGRGQFGDVYIKIEPLPRGGGYEFHDKIVGGAVPGKFIPAVDKGLQESINHGVLAGYPVVDASFTLYDGSFHAVDSSEMAFKIAASLAFKKGMQDAGPVMLEPIMELEIYAPEDSTGDVMGDLSSRRGKILGMEPHGRGQIVRALVPQAELYHYSATLRSFTGGRGRFTQKFSTYEQIPRDQADRIIAEAKAALEEHE